MKLVADPDVSATDRSLRPEQPPEARTARKTRMWKKVENRTIRRRLSTIKYCAIATYSFVEFLYLRGARMNFERQTAQVICRNDGFVVVLSWLYLRRPISHH